MKKRWDKRFFLLVYVIVPIWNRSPDPDPPPPQPPAGPLFTRAHPCGLPCHPRDLPDHPEGSEPDQSPHWLNSEGQTGSIRDRLLPPLSLSLITHTSPGLRSNMWPHRSAGWIRSGFERMIRRSSACASYVYLQLGPSRFYCQLMCGATSDTAVNPGVFRGRVTSEIRTRNPSRDLCDPTGPLILRRRLYLIKTHRWGRVWEKRRSFSVPWETFSAAEGLYCSLVFVFFLGIILSRDSGCSHFKYFSAYGVLQQHQLCFVWSSAFTLKLLFVGVYWCRNAHSRVCLLFVWVGKVAEVYIHTSLAGIIVLSFK